MHFPELSNLSIKLQVQSVLKSVPIHYTFTKTLKGVLLTLRKDELQGSSVTSPNDV